MKLLQLHSIDQNILAAFDPAFTGYEAIASELSRLDPARLVADYSTNFEARVLPANSLAAINAWAHEHGISEPAGDQELMACLKRMIDDFAPDILLVDDPLNFGGTFVNGLENRPRLLIGWLGSLPPRGTDLGAFDMVLATSELVQAQARRCGAPQTAVLRLGYPDTIKPHGPEEPRELDVIFIGEVEPGHKLAQQLAKLSQAPMLWRGEFEQAYRINTRNPRQLPTGLSMYDRGPATGLELIHAYAQSRIAIHAAHDLVTAEAGQNIFLAAGSGALILAEKRGSITDLFDPESEMLTFDDTDSLIDSIYEMLENPERLVTIARAGQKRCLREHSLRARALELERIINELIAQPGRIAAQLLAEGEDLFGRGELAQAQILFGKVMVLDALNIDALINLGVTAWQMGDQTGAVANFKKALDLSPGHKDAILNLGEAYKALDMNIEAASIYKAYLAKHSDTEVRAALDEIAPPQKSIPIATSEPWQILELLLGTHVELNKLNEMLRKAGGNLISLVPELELWQQRLAANRQLGPLANLISSLDPLRTAQLPQRFELGLSYFKTPLAELLNWLIKSKENTNFTYDLSTMNREHLAWFVVGVTGLPVAQARQYLREIEEDEDLKQHVRRYTLASPERYQADEEARYGRRIGWYAFVRALKPRVVVETGVDKGIGTCVLAAALMRNAAEGSPGLVYGLDINPQAGFLFKEPYSRYGRLLIGDSLATLKAFDQIIDLFIHDSNHDPVFERKEFETVQAKLAPEALILSDNAHVTAELYKYAEETDRQFLYFQEKPTDHFYPGGSIGAAFFKPTTAQAAARPAATAATCEQQYYDEGYFEWQKTIGRFGGRANLFKFADFVEGDPNRVGLGCGAARKPRSRAKRRRFSRRPKGWRVRSSRARARKGPRRSGWTWRRKPGDGSPSPPG